MHRRPTTVACGAAFKKGNEIWGPEHGKQKAANPTNDAGEPTENETTTGTVAR